MPWEGRIHNSPRMTHEQRCSLIKGILILLVILATGTGVWLYDKPKSLAGKVQIANPQPVVTSPAKPAAMPLKIVHRELPGDPVSRQLGEDVDRIQKKYGHQVIVTHEEIQPGERKNGKAVPTHVVMFLGNEKVFESQGVWPFAKLEHKVEEFLYRIARVGKDWRPTVPGMTPAGN